MWLVLLLALSAEELLSRSIAHHDPEGRWERGAFRIVLAESRPDGTERRTTVVLDNGRGRFEMRREVQGEEPVEVSDGSGLTDPQERMRNYYLYLYGLPMKLRDPGTRLSPEVKESTFQGAPALELRVTYDEEVGSDTWYFYFDRESHALVGYRFYHDESAGDGEYIALSEEAAGGGLRLPRVRKWYTNRDGEFLGTDTILSITPAREDAAR